MDVRAYETGGQAQKLGRLASLHAARTGTMGQRHSQRN